MSHAITALIGTAEDLADLALRLGEPQPTVLPFGLVIIPLDETRLDQLATYHATSHDGFTYLNPDLQAVIARAVPAGNALYIETEYFGGTGKQAAALFVAGELQWRGAHAGEPRGKPPISRGLAALGVRPVGREDEFDTVDLGRFRSLAHLGISDPDD